MNTYLGFPNAVCLARLASVPHPSVRATRPEPIGPGCAIGGQYILRELVGHGGMGVVYRAEQPLLERSVAIKFLHPDQRDAWGMRRFREEAMTAGQLRHPNTIAVLDMGETEGGTPYLVMEYVHGCTLRELIRRDDVPSQRRAADIVGQILAGLDDAHRNGVIHADVKSDNVMVGENLDGADVVKLVDFGLARSGADDLGDEGVSGTAEYLAPEVIRGGSPTVASDLYAVGCILFELLTGTTPFTGEFHDVILQMHLRDEPPALATRRDDRTFSEALQAVVTRALQKDPRARFATAAELAAALAEAVPTCDDAVVRKLRTEIHGELRVEAYEAVVARTVELADLLAAELRPSEAIDELEGAVALISARIKDPIRAGRLLWPLLATLARHLDDAGERPAARRIAAHAERQAIKSGSPYGREATRILLLHLALRR